MKNKYTSLKKNGKIPFAIVMFFNVRLIYLQLNLFKAEFKLISFKRKIEHINSLFQFNGL